MKLSPLAIWIIGIAFCLIALFYGAFQQWIPNEADASAYDANTKLQNDEAAKQGQANKRVQKAVEMVKAKDAEWQAVVATRTPSTSVATGGINLAVNGYQLVIDSRAFRNNIQRAVNAQLLKGGVKIINGPTVPFPDQSTTTILANFFNYPAIPFPVVIFDLGTVTVTGSYGQIMNHLRSFKTMPHYLAVTDALALTGTSPNLTATYTLTLVGYIRGKQIYPPVPEVAAATSGGGFGGGFGGFAGAPGGFGGAASRGGPGGGSPVGISGSRGGG